MAIISGLAAAFGTAKAAGVDPLQEAKGVVSDIFGSSKPQSCGEKQRVLANRLNVLPRTELAEIARKHRRMFGSGVRPDASQLARHYYGGGDCKVSSQKGRRFQTMVDDKLRKHETSQDRNGQPDQSVATGGGLSMNTILIGLALLAGGWFLFMNQ